MRILPSATTPELAKKAVEKASTFYKQKATAAINTNLDSVEKMITAAGSIKDDDAD